ncbi:endonuclease domain-containing protein [Allosphingosinicella sp.]|uniref:endonuclease domain-containing protein n=1 Tax=Allosphingosinicella sp. TaxID=2823234 RepID=UPI003D75C6B9
MGEGLGRGGRSAAQRASALGAAKHSRSHPTDAEHRLWLILRAKRLGGWKFRREPPIGPYRPDFVCYSAKLIVEADGGQHGPERDGGRDEWLCSQGFRILRFWNNDILTNEEGVLTTIVSALEASAAASSRDARTPLPNPSPTRGEGLSGASHA